MVYAVDLAG